MLASRSACRTKEEEGRRERAEGRGDGPLIARAPPGAISFAHAPRRRSPTGRPRSAPRGEAACRELSPRAPRSSGSGSLEGTARSAANPAPLHASQAWGASAVALPSALGPEVWRGLHDRRWRTRIGRSPNVPSVRGIARLVATSRAPTGEVGRIARRASISVDRSLRVFRRRVAVSCAVSGARSVDRACSGCRMSRRPSIGALARFVWRACASAARPEAEVLAAVGWPGLETGAGERKSRLLTAGWRGVGRRSRGRAVEAGRGRSTRFT